MTKTTIWALLALFAATARGQTPTFSDTSGALFQNQGAPGAGVSQPALRGHKSVFLVNNGTGTATVRLACDPAPGDFYSVLTPLTDDVAVPPAPTPQPSPVEFTFACPRLVPLLVTCEGCAVSGWLRSWAW